MPENNSGFRVALAFARLLGMTVNLHQDQRKKNSPPPFCDSVEYARVGQTKMIYGSFTVTRDYARAFISLYP